VDANPGHVHGNTCGRAQPAFRVSDAGTNRQLAFRIGRVSLHISGVNSDFAFYFGLSSSSMRGTPASPFARYP
jgi:hypothetical protein